MDRRDLRRSDWRRITRRRYVCRPCARDGIEGVAALIAIDAVSEPLTVDDGHGGRVVIADAGYTWLQFAPKDRFFWLTVMFDPDGRLVQMYFDITAGAEFGDPENPTFEDMYLDIVVSASGETRLLDADELDAALARGAIDRPAYDAANAHGRALWDWLRDNRMALMDECRRERERLIALL